MESVYAILDRAGLVASAVELVRAWERADFADTSIYRIPAYPGVLFRRVTRDGRQGLTAGDGNVVALGPGGTREGEPMDKLCEFVRWTAAEKMLLAVLPANDPMDQDAHEVPDSERKRG